MAASAVVGRHAEMLRAPRIAWYRQVVTHRMLLVVIGYAVTFVVFGFSVASPAEIGSGLARILLAPDALITDYVGVGGTGAAFVNAGVLTLLACLLYVVAGAEITGTSIAALLLVLGFGLFGKNLLNVWCVVGGVLAYVAVKREALGPHLNTAMFGAALAPVFSEVLFSTWLPWGAAVPLSIVTSLVLGLVLVPVAGHLFAAHQGFSLYNMGFAAGLLGFLVVAVYRSFGFVPEPNFIWSTGHNVLFGVLFTCVFVLTILLGLVLDRNALRSMRTILALSGRSPCDFVAQAGSGGTLVNMGACGLIGLVYVLAVGSELNGPTIAALFTLVGFAACGKHPRNIVPVLVGVFLAALSKQLDVAESGVVLAALFGTSLAPIPGSFGWVWGVLAGAVHVSAVQLVGDLHGGLNLYNNGLAAGLVAAVIVPVAFAVRDRRPGQSDDRALRP